MSWMSEQSACKFTLLIPESTKKVNRFHKRNPYEEPYPLVFSMLQKSFIEKCRISITYPKSLRQESQENFSLMLLPFQFKEDI